jgi:hypothetical protein
MVRALRCIGRLLASSLLDGEWVALAVISGRLTRADLANWVLLCVLPITAAFFVARSQRLRGHRLVAACVAFVSYLVALLVGINIGMVVGVLKE